MNELPVRTPTEVRLRNRKWGRWINRGIWTLTDRGLFALSNFVLNVTLARWMSPDAYGAFTIAFSIFLLMGGAQSSLVVGPLLVFGPGRYRDRFRTYLGLVIKGQLALSLLVSVCLALVGGGFLLRGSPGIGNVLLALALAGPFILLLQLLRQAGYVHLRPKQAAAAGAAYMVLLMTGTYLFYHLRVLSPVTALFLMGACSLVVAIWLILRQQVRPFDERLRGDFGREVVLEHWRYGRWMLPARVLTVGHRNFFLFILPFYAGLEAVGALRALMNLVMPITYMEQWLNVITVPALARARTSGTLREKVTIGITFFAAGSLAYGVALVLFQHEIIEMLYAGRYSSYTHFIWLIALLPVVRSVSIMLDSALRAMERPKDVFRASLGAAGCAGTIGLGAVVTAGVLGAIIGLLLSGCVFTILLLWFVRSADRRASTAHVT